jgi:hypothetical protein
MVHVSRVDRLNEWPRRVKFDGKVYKQTKFGEGLQPGTVEWEQRKRQERADDRELLEQEVSRRTHTYLSGLTDQQLNKDMELHFPDGSGIGLSAPDTDLNRFE